MTSLLTPTNILLLSSIALNIALITTNLLSYTNSNKNTKQQLQQPTTTDDIYTPINKNSVELYSKTENIQRSKSLFKQASQINVEKGDDGYRGWLLLLAAVDIDSTHKEALENLVQNYMQVNYHVLGYSELSRSNISQDIKDTIIPILKQEQYENEMIRLQHDFLSKPLPPLLSFISAFETLYGTWDLTTLLPSTLNQDIYSAIVNEYEHLKQTRLDIANNPTELNHALFKVQMSKLDKTSSYWGSMTNIKGFDLLVSLMRRTAKEFLLKHGWSNHEANRKASHPLVVWLSVHTPSSVHQPHVTADALIGGVYYISIPPGSGRLEIYDPRGKHPIYDLKNPISPPNPPFHRTHGVKPKESMLVLFPGWCVHSVLSSSSPPSSQQEENMKYRVSLSLNLKGEWQDTVVSHRIKM
jgi:uncharacterized protein (TIGR02466 family)